MTLDALLLQPPFLRLVGSHNDRLPLELAYLNGYLQRNGLSTLMLNADGTGAARYVKWCRLFENFELFERAVEGDSPLYDETIERVLTFEPNTVILAAADAITPWVDLGNAYFTAELSQRLRRYGVYTIGVGPFFGAVPEKFIDSFDTILVGAASPSIIDVVRLHPCQPITSGEPIDISEPPLFTPVIPDGRADVFMTAIGCPQHCRFCFAAETGSLRIPIDVVLRDVSNRSSSNLDIGDAIFTLSPRRIYQLAEALGPLGKTYACEVSARTMTEDSLMALRELGVKTVKLGIEVANDRALADMRKNQTIAMMMHAIELIRKHNFSLVAYVLLGGTSSPADAERTLEFCLRVGPDDLVVNVSAYHDLKTRDFRYDSHFSRRLARAWQVQDMLARFFELQSVEKIGLGRLI